jgi:hypothetical protein
MKSAGYALSELNWNFEIHLTTINSTNGEIRKTAQRQIEQLYRTS